MRRLNRSRLEAALEFRRPFRLEVRVARIAGDEAGRIRAASPYRPLPMLVVAAANVWSAAVAPGCTPVAPYALRRRN